MKASHIFLIIGLTLILNGCLFVSQEKGNGEIVKKDQSLDNFEEVVISGNFSVNLIKSDKPALSIAADENLFEFIEVEVIGDRLVIETTRELRGSEEMELDIFYTELTAVDVGGAASVRSQNVIAGDYFNFSLAGAGEAELELDLKVLKISLSGAGSLELRGKVGEQSIEMSGAGGLEAYDLISESTQINISGVGGAEVTATKKLKANVSGLGGISYRGNPADVDTNVSGLGSITADDEENEGINY